MTTYDINCPILGQRLLSPVSRDTGEVSQLLFCAWPLGWWPFWVIAIPCHYSCDSQGVEYDRPFFGCKIMPSEIFSTTLCGREFLLPLHSGIMSAMNNSQMPWKLSGSTGRSVGPTTRFSLLSDHRVGLVLVVVDSVCWRRSGEIPTLFDRPGGERKPAPFVSWKGTGEPRPDHVLGFGGRECQNLFGRGERMCGRARFGLWIWLTVPLILVSLRREDVIPLPRVLGGRCAERRRNAMAGKTGDSRINTLTSGIFRHDSHMWKFASPRRESSPTHLDVLVIFSGVLGICQFGFSGFGLGARGSRDPTAILDSGLPLCHSSHMTTISDFTIAESEIELSSSVKMLVDKKGPPVGRYLFAR
ncbi:hypothetical protein PR048_016381 [Dryococelus australis]|uniref:Uncharacterized protein n=1 Tax=Dryococelus australis TaxID=614101 RepID=A0ABQ9HJK1_9NEOP|nr:hypothetical protein PR048_016381 [Dryococelus australis]